MQPKAEPIMIKNVFKRAWIIVVNVLIISSVIVFTLVYSSSESNNATKVQIDHFQNTAITMEHVTENYLEGEQRVCDVWAHYIDKTDEPMDIEDAIGFIQNTHVLQGASAHIVPLDTLVGKSTKDIHDDLVISTADYRGKDFMSDISWIAEPIGSSINITRKYTNPVNSELSIAFCNLVRVKEGGVAKDAVLLRVMPSLELHGKWEVPQEEFKNAEFAIIDRQGNYIIKNEFGSFTHENFFDFYKYKNKINANSRQEIITRITTTEGSFMMNDFEGTECILAHAPFSTDTGGWALLCLMPTKYLTANTQNWLLIGVISSALLLLFVFDLVVMLYFNKKLMSTAKEAYSANKAKTIFLSTMSHDIRTPMNAIIGLTTITEKNLDDKKTVRENLHKISLASNHLLTLINDILDISKVESGKLNLVPQTFSLVETVENLMNISQPMIKEKNIDFDFRVNRIEKEYLYADQLRLNQIFINLLSNAIKYTEPGGSVHVDMKEEESQKEGCVRLTYRVADTGIGMSPEFLKNLYQPFVRQTDSRVNKIQGTGLGLAITKQMVDLMEGSIDCQSEEGKGTTFTVILDIPAATHQKADITLEPMRVLLVDDDEILLQTATDTLKSLGLEVDIAHNGIEACEKIKNDKYDLAIIDSKMPGIDGLETIRRIRSELKSDLPALLTSAYAWSDIEQEAKEIGVNGFLSKPLFRSTLGEKINEVLGNEAQSKEAENDDSDLQGLNILVAEDNDINWEIISTLLGMYGITTERAENGRIAIEKMQQAEKGRYTLVFMDIQMPEVNGLEATKAIRALPDPWASSIPIIAMTADAFAENIAECFEAGMNGHIAKPIDIKIVIKEIRKAKGESNS